MTNKTVPPAPETLIIEQTSAHNLRKWVEYFKNLSPRILLIKPDFPNFQTILEECKQKTVNHNGIDFEYYRLEDWPDPSDVAFIIQINTGKPGHFPKYNAGNMFIFTFGDIAFGLLNYFSLEGDTDDPNRDTYSLREMSRHTLSWEFIGQTIIPDRIRYTEDSVPKFPI